MDYFVTALTGEPFGLEGFVRLKPLSGVSSHLLKLKKIRLRGGTSLKNGVWERDFLAVDLIQHKNGEVFVRFEGVNSIEEAKKLKGAEVLVEREYAAPLFEGEYYIEDLKKLNVLGTNGVQIGKVNDVLEGGGSFLIEILCSDSKTRLVPFKNEFFSNPDMKNQTITLLQDWILREV